MLYLTHRGQLTVWRHDTTSSKKPLPKRRLIGDEILQYQEWQKEAVYDALDFNGPFHVMRLHETTYLLVEETGDVYSLATTDMRKVGQIALPSERHTAGQATSLLVIDKDREALLWYDSVHDTLTPPIFLENHAIKTDHARFSQLQQALRSALAGYGWLPEGPGAP